MVKIQGEVYICDRCRTAYPTKVDAEKCEARHRLIEMWREGKIDDLAVARGLGLPTDTPEQIKSSLRSVANLLQKGADTSLSADTMVGATMRESPPILVGVTKIHGDGRTQIPATIRGIWGVKDEDFVFWYRQGDHVLLAPQSYTAPHRQPHFVGPSRELPSPP